MKASLRETPLKRHLTAFESRSRSPSRPGSLSLVPPAGSLSMARTISTAHALVFFVRTRRGFEIV